MLKGGLESMAPERMLGSRQFGPPTDLWSLGVMLWEMGTGRPFFPSSRLKDIAQTCRARSPDEEATSLAAFFPDAAVLVRGLLQRDHDQRTQRAADVVKELEALAEASPCEGGAQQLMDRIAVLEQMEPTGQTSTEGCTWDAILGTAGPLRVVPRPGATPRPHRPGRGGCLSYEPQGAWGRNQVAEHFRTADWSILPDDESGRTDDWSTPSVEDER